MNRRNFLRAIPAVAIAAMVPWAPSEPEYLWVDTREWGLNIRSYQTPQGNINVIQHPDLLESDR